MEENFIEIEIDPEHNLIVDSSYSLANSLLENNCTSYNYFFHNFMRPNRACIIKNASNSWNAAKYWVTEQGKPDFTYLREKYGKSKVTVYHCNEKYFNSHKTSEHYFEDYLEYWINFAEGKSVQEDLLYLKDWHLKNLFPNDDFYEVPKYFASDWLNEFLVDNGRDDYRFVYMGPKGTWTPFHADVFMSYSWSTNICGRKRWIILPPGEETKLKDSLGNLPFDISGKLSNVTYYEFIQNTGDAVFVPSGWHHQVWNLDNTISINHNWFNGTNIDKVCKALLENFDLVRKEIDDCKDMEDFSGHCQMMLKASFGMDVAMFCQLLRHIALKRIPILVDNVCDVMFNGYVIGKIHAENDLRSISSIFHVLVKFETSNQIKLEDKENIVDLLKTIDICLNNNKFS